MVWLGCEYQDILCSISSLRRPHYSLNRTKNHINKLGTVKKWSVLMNYPLR